MQKKQRAEFKCARQCKPRADVRGQMREGFSFACGPVCANTTRSELRHKTMIGRSKRYRMLALDPFRGVSEKREDFNACDAEVCVCVCSVTAGKKESDDTC